MPGWGERNTPRGSTKLKTGVDIAPGLPEGTVDGAPNTQTPSRAEYGPGGCYAFSEIAQVCIGARPTGAFPLVMSGDGIGYRGGVIR